MADFDAAFIFLRPDTQTGVERAPFDQPGAPTCLAWVPDAESAAQVADELATDGVRLIELYRGFDLAGAATVISAVRERASVGVATYGFATAPTDRPRHSVTIVADPDPTIPRVVQGHPDGGTTTVVSAADERAAAVASEHVEQGAELIEICGGTPLTTAAAVAEAVGMTVPVSLVSWPFESLDGVAAYKAAFEESVA